MSTTEKPAAERHAPPPGVEPPPRGRGGIVPRVFYPAAIVVGLFVLVAALFPGPVGTGIAAAQDTVVGGLGWYYVLLIAVFVGFSVWLAVSRFGDIVLGDDDSEPEFGVVTWFSLLFAAGMGIGLVFWGVAEPLNHLAKPPPGVSGSDSELAQSAIDRTFLHWGIHAWAVYVIVGLAIAYAVHRRGRPVSIRWALEPVLGDRVSGRWGDVIDVVAIVGTLFGVATSLGFGVSQLGAGLEFMGWVEASNPVLVLLIAAITVIATLSVVSGVHKGLTWLSNANLALAALLLVIVLIVGPTLFLLREFVESLGSYLQNFIQMTFDTAAYERDAGEAWQAQWTTYYWGWWISWSPFVGVFIARISRGRTVREFVLGVLFVPALVTFFWFAIMGGAALYRQLFQEGDLIGRGGAVDDTGTLYQLLDGMPGGPGLVVLALILVVLFFVAGSDSGSLVVAMLTSGGDPEPPRWAGAFWSILQGAVASVLLLAGGLEALQTMSILVAVPFSLVMLLMLVSITKALGAERRELRRLERLARRREMVDHVGDELGERVAGAKHLHPIGTRLGAAMSGDGYPANGNGTNGDGDPSADEPPVAADAEAEALRG